MDYALPILLGLPLLGAITGAMLPNPRACRIWAITISLLTLAWSVIIAFHFGLSGDTAAIKFGFPGAALSRDTGIDLSIHSIGFSVHLGIDSISLWLVLLTTVLTPLAIASSFQSIRQREKEYYAWMLALLSAMLGVFVARDLLLFYIFFELTLVPMFFIIGIWGGPQRRYAAGKFFLFTFAGSVFTLAAVIYLGINASFDIDAVVAYAQSKDISERARYLVLLGLLAGFAVKVPLFPVHTWLPLAHTEAPTAGSVILAGVLLKLGTYGLLRVAGPIGLVTASGPAFPALLKLLGAICIVGILYGALVAWVQRDIKKLVAYSSVSHLGFCVLGLVAMNTIGIQGSLLYMINHGISTGAMFLVVGMIYDRHHTRDIDQLSGLAHRMPKMAFFFVLFTLSSIGLPGLNGFVSEFLTVLGAFTSPHLGISFGVLAALGVILGAVYMLHMTARVIFGPLKTPGGHEHGQHTHAPGESHGNDALPTDLNGREISVLAPLALAVVILGVAPGLILRSTERPVKKLQEVRQVSASASGGAPGSPAQPSRSTARP